MSKCAGSVWVCVDVHMQAFHQVILLLNVRMPMAAAPCLGLS